tara:strand:- start:5466 stop:9593 length:4128 start_codon:yes stop_codon:yes gene_type:complete
VLKFTIHSSLKRTFFLIILFTGCFTATSQTVSVDNTGFTPQQLVDLLLANSCATNSNISISSNQSVAYFNNNGSVFPIPEGIIIRSGIATNSQGPYTGNGLDSQVTTNSDPDLQAISNQSGQSATITDAAFLEFEFTPSSTNFSFDFLFASNEYGEWQCGFSDVFAFLLTDLTTGITTNLAVIPGTNTPISVRDIRDSQYNSSCNSVNANLFGTYNVNDPGNSALNMRGHTTVLNASSPVIPNNTYRIKLVIGDYNDTNFDSAVFIQAGSFNTTLDIGPDQEICDGDNIILDSNYTNTTDFSYEWQRNGVALIGETNPTLTVTQSGTYDLTITTISTGCTLTDQAIITDLQVTPPNDLLECDTGNTIIFNLTLNDHLALGIDPSEYDVLYYNSLANANNNAPINNALVTSYPALGGETIYMRIRNINSSNLCTTVYDFNLNITARVVAAIPNDINACIESDITIDISGQVESQILNGLNPSNYTVSYFTSEADAQNNINAIPDPSAFSRSNNINPLPIWARLIDNNNALCFDIVTFNINLFPSPEAPVINSQVFVCTEYTLPPLDDGNYFTGPDGTGTQLNAGDVITTGLVVYVFLVNANGCSNQVIFEVRMADEYDISREHCGEFIVPSYPNAEIYSAPGGPGGIGSLIPGETVLTSNQTIYFYAVDDNGDFCADIQLDIIVHPLPPVDTLSDLVTCDSYTLPPVVNGGYFTEESGGGTQMFPGDQITSTQRVYIFNEDTITTCGNETFFEVTIIDTSVFQDLDACGSYTLPNVDLGGYFTGPTGTGSSIPQGTVITTSQTVYYYAPEVTTVPNCTDNIAIDITINPIPLVDTLNDVLRCIDDLPTLQPLVNGQYFTETGGQGTQLNAGDVINTTQTIYIYNTNAFCDAETSFNVEIRPFPSVDNFTDIFSCEPYTLPVLSGGRYYTESGAQGLQLNAGDVISTTQTVYIYNDYNDLAGCTNENVFTINILDIEVDEPEDVLACESYELPPLTVGNYFTEPGGLGTSLNAGDIITTTQALYVYAEIGTRFLCSDEHQFTITISQTPTLPPLPNLEGCESVTLPTLNIPGVEVSYYTRPNREGLIASSDYTITQLGSRIIYVYANAIGDPDCFTEGLYQITVYPLLDLQIEGGTICIDADTGETRNSLLLQSGLDPNEFTVNWFLNNEMVGTGSDYEAIEAGTYTVETEKLNPDMGSNCNYAPTEVVVNSSSPKFEVNFITSTFAQNSTVEIVTVNTGLGRYEFSLDNGSFQKSNRFYNIVPGTHTITIRDLTSLCGDFVFEFIALDYPKFFTPNNDGINDTWNIYDLRNNPEATVKIFSRLGRLVATIKTSELGWNGFNNGGKEEASSDYWFLVEFNYNGVPTSFKGNFSLLRR